MSDEDTQIKTEDQTLIGIIRYCNELMGRLIESGGDITEFEQEFSAVEIAKAKKIDNYELFMRHCESQIEILDEQIKVRQSQKQYFKRIVDFLQTNLKLAMGIMQTETLEGGEYYFKLRKATQKVVIENEDHIPAVFCKTIYEPDTKLIKEKLLAGEHIEGARIEENRALLRNSLRKAIPKETTSNDDQ